MTFEEYLENALTQLMELEEVSSKHYVDCNNGLCLICAMAVLVPYQIAVIKSALVSEERGICDDPTCISYIAYNIATALFKEVELKNTNQ